MKHTKGNWEINGMQIEVTEKDVTSTFFEGGEITELAQWWTDYQNSDEGKKHAYVNTNQGKPSFKAKSSSSPYPKKRRKPRQYDKSKSKAKNQGS